MSSASATATQPDAFAGALGADAAAALRARAVPRRFTRGEALMHADQVPREVFALRAGRVKVSGAVAGRELLLAFRGPGELVGELSAIDELPRSATVVALEPVEALVVSHEVFRRCLGEHPQAALALLRTLSARLRDADAKRIQLGGHSSLGRVALCLLELCDRFGELGPDGIEIQLPITQEELAGWAGASLESTGRALATMRRLGWIETRRRAVRVRDRGALERARA